MIWSLWQPTLNLRAWIGSSAATLILLISAWLWVDAAWRRHVARNDLDLVSRRVVSLEPLRRQVAEAEQKSAPQTIAAQSVPEARASLQSELRRVLIQSGATLLSLSDEPSAAPTAGGRQSTSFSLRIRVAAKDLLTTASAIEQIAGMALLRTTITPLRDAQSSVEVRAVLRAEIEVSR